MDYLRDLIGKTGTLVVVTVLVTVVALATGGIVLRVF